MEDEAAIILPLRYALEREGWQVSWTNTGTQALQLLSQQGFDFIILDEGLPDINGFEVCKQLRQKYQTPLLFLTARDDEIDRVVVLEIGADDYCGKPFSAREIVARIKAFYFSSKAGWLAWKALLPDLYKITLWLGAMQYNQPMFFSLGYHYVCAKTACHFTLLRSRNFRKSSSFGRSTGR